VIGIGINVADAAHDGGRLRHREPDGDPARATAQDTLARIAAPLRLALVGFDAEGFAPLVRRLCAARRAARPARAHDRPGDARRRRPTAWTTTAR
jgi:hypothetical protein